MKSFDLTTRAFFVLLISTFFSWGISAQEQLIDLEVNQPNKTITTLPWLADTSKTLNIQQVSAASFQNNFKEHDGVSPTIDYDVYWMKFDLKNATSKDGVWVLNFAKWVDVKFYFKTNSESSYSEKRTGHLLPLKERDYAVGNRNFIKLAIPENETMNCFVRLETNYDYIFRPANLNFIIQTETANLKAETKIKNFVFMFLGVYLVMFFYNLFILFSTRDKSYAYYLAILVIMSIVLIHNFGYLHTALYFIEDFPRWHGQVELYLSAAMGVSIFFFTSSFLELKTRLPKWQKFLNILTVFVLLHPLPSFFGYTFANYEFSSLLGIIAMIVVMTIGIKSYRIGTPSAGYFILAYSAFILSIIILLVGIIAQYWEDDFAPAIVTVGSAVEIVLFSFALGNKINYLRNDNEEKQLQIIEQLNENQKLQTKVNRELEEKVKERTQEIEKQKEEIVLEKDKSDKLLLNILPISTAEELKQYGYASTKYYEMVTVLFTDVEQFTSHAEQMPPEELVQNLDYCFKAFDEIVEKNNLEKIKTIGDAYMCAGGVPDANTTNPEDAINAAFEMKIFIRGWKEKMISEGKTPWEFRIGIHTGEVIAGVVGKNKFAYDIWGDTVNIASRMESEGSTEKINVSASTYLLVQEKFKFTPRGKILAKGKGAINMYYLEES